MTEICGLPSLLTCMRLSKNGGLICKMIESQLPQEEMPDSIGSSS
jgi:hypothetical protein